MTEAVTYDEWRAITLYDLTPEELEEVDFFLDDGTVLFRNDWDGSNWVFEGIVVMPIYEDSIDNSLQIVGFIEYPEFFDREPFLAYPHLGE